MIHWDKRNHTLRVGKFKFCWAKHKEKLHSCNFEGNLYISRDDTLWKRVDRLWQLVHCFDSDISELYVTRDYLYVALEEK